MSLNGREGMLGIADQHESRRRAEPGADSDVFGVTVQAGCGRQLKKVFKILQLDLDIA
jgi:hypothetical protein